MSIPGLPIELEQLCFEELAQTHPISTLSLMLVAWRVKEWVEPFLYRTLIAGLKAGPEFPNIFWDEMAMLQRRDLTIRSHCRNLLLFQPSMSQIVSALKAFPNIADLYLATNGATDDVDSEFPAAFNGLRSLRRLHCDLEIFENDFPEAEIFRQPGFASVTHLELFDRPFDMRNPDCDPETWRVFADLPALTHLAMENTPPVRFVEYLLVKVLPPTTSKLRVFAMQPDDGMTRTPFRLSTALRHEARLVIMDWPDWRAGWEAGVLVSSREDMWGKVERILEERRVRVRETGEVFCHERFVEEANE
ncbi:hypothetical protein MKEN_00949100 [Mycena kentingensis (nom. inval.)]|nr:hypothetical protein MKEN_00949100 [Mycena kentingensis (nom. inval.)]